MHNNGLLSPKEVAAQYRACGSKQVRESIALHKKKRDEIVKSMDNLRPLTAKDKDLLVLLDTIDREYAIKCVEIAELEDHLVSVIAIENSVAIEEIKTKHDDEKIVEPRINLPKCSLAIFVDTLGNANNRMSTMHYAFIAPNLSKCYSLDKIDIVPDAVVVPSHDIMAICKAATKLNANFRSVPIMYVPKDRMTAYISIDQKCTIYFTEAEMHKAKAAGIKVNYVDLTTWINK